MNARDAIIAALDAMPADGRPSVFVNVDRAQAALDALKAAGYAVVELPNPDGPLGLVDGEPKGLAWRRVADPDAEAGGLATVATSGWVKEIHMNISCLRTVQDARWAASALLAAADALEAES